MDGCPKRRSGRPDQLFNNHYVSKAPYAEIARAALTVAKIQSRSLCSLKAIHLVTEERVQRRLRNMIFLFFSFGMFHLSTMSAARAISAYGAFET